MRLKTAPGECAATARALLESAFGPAANSIQLSIVPGRVNLIGEHIDYHLLPVLPMAIDRKMLLAYRQNGLRAIRAVSALAGPAAPISLDRQKPSAPGDWTNYIKAAVNALSPRWELQTGIDAAVVADLPVAAGLSSSSALLTAFALALLRANGITPEWNDLMQALPQGEQFVGTRGGSMDHAAVLGGQVGCALYIEFDPLLVRPVPVPDSWAFIVAHSLQAAEKSSTVRERYNALRVAGNSALHERGYVSFRQALSQDRNSVGTPVYTHVLTEAARVNAARNALENNDLQSFGELMLASHASLRNRLGVSTPALDALVEAAMRAGATGARLTGAGFGGCVLAVCSRDRVENVLDRLVEHYRHRSDFDPSQHLFEVKPSQGALAYV